MRQAYPRLNRSPPTLSMVHCSSPTYVVIDEKSGVGRRTLPRKACSNSAEQRQGVTPVSSHTASRCRIRHSGERCCLRRVNMSHYCHQRVALASRRYGRGTGVYVSWPVVARRTPRLKHVTWQARHAAAHVQQRVQDATMFTMSRRPWWQRSVEGTRALLARGCRCQRHAHVTPRREARWGYGENRRMPSTAVDERRRHNVMRFGAAARVADGRREKMMRRY